MCCLREHLPQDFGLDIATVTHKPNVRLQDGSAGTRGGPMTAGRVLLLDWVTTTERGTLPRGTVLIESTPARCL